MTIISYDLFMNKFIFSIAVFICVCASALADVNEYDLRGDEFLRESKYHEAIDCYWLSIRNDPIQPYSYSRLATAYASIGMRTESQAMEARSKALEKHQEWVRKGDGFYAEQRYVEAIEAYERAFEYFNESYIACEKLALTYNKTGQKEKSYEMYKQSHELRTAQKMRVAMEDASETPSLDAIEKIRKDWAFTREDELLRRKYESDTGYTIMLAQPLYSGNNNQLNSLVFVPPLEGAKTVARQAVYVTTNVDVSTGSFSNNGANWSTFYDQRVLEPSMSIKYGLLDNLEIRFYLSIPTLADLTRNQGVIIDSSATSYVPNAERSWGVGDFIPSLKYQITKGNDSISGTAIAAALKMPLADKYNFVSSGGPDISVNFIVSRKYGQSIWHFNLGYTMVGDPTIFTDNLALENVISFGVGYVLNMTDNFSMDLQIEGNTNAFSIIEGYDGIPMTLIAGGKYHTKYFLIELGLGTGVGKLSSDFTTTFGITTRF